MHAPFLSAVRDRDGDGVAEERRDLLTGLGLPPEKNPSRLHCANGVVVGHDGWLYLALGDNGCDVPRPEGDRLVYHGGGILRCRPDGRDLHVFATGLRNIYDVALDEELNVFVRDNENDGGDYLIRVDHSFFGADHGYPYLYAERPDEALPSLAVLGRGSSAGGLCYLEAGFPAEYRGDLFFCEWGRAVVRYRPARSGSGFAPLGAGRVRRRGRRRPLRVQADRPRRPARRLVDRGRLGGRPEAEARARPHLPDHGRRASRTAPRPAGGGIESEIARLDSESYAERCEAQGRTRTAGGPRGSPPCATRSDGPASACGGGCMPCGSWPTRAGRPRSTNSWNWPGPIPTRGSRPRRSGPWRTWPTRCSPRHRLASGPGDGDAGRAAGRAGGGPRPARGAGSHDRRRPAALGRGTGLAREALRQPDAALAHAAMQALRRSANWPAVLALLDGPDSATDARPGAAGARRPRRAGGRRRPDRPPGGRNPPGAASSSTPNCSPGSTRSPGPGSTGDTARPRARRTRSPGNGPRRSPRRSTACWATPTPPCGWPCCGGCCGRRSRPGPANAPSPCWRPGRGSDVMVAIIEALGDHPADERRDLLAEVVADRSQKPANRLAALALWPGGDERVAQKKLVELAGGLEDGPVLAAALRRVTKRSLPSSASLVTGKLVSPDPDVACGGGRGRRAPWPIGYGRADPALARGSGSERAPGGGGGRRRAGSEGGGGPAPRAGPRPRPGRPARRPGCACASCTSPAPYRWPSGRSPIAKSGSPPWSASPCWVGPRRRSRYPTWRSAAPPRRSSRSRSAS